MEIIHLNREDALAVKVWAVAEFEWVTILRAMG